MYIMLLSIGLAPFLYFTLFSVEEMSSAYFGHYRIVTTSTLPIGFPVWISPAQTATNVLHVLYMFYSVLNPDVPVRFYANRSVNNRGDGQMNIKSQDLSWSIINTEQCRIKILLLIQTWSASVSMPQIWSGIDQHWSLIQHVLNPNCSMIPGGALLYIKQAC